MEDVPFDFPLYRQFAGPSLMKRLRDLVTILRFRRLLEQHGQPPTKAGALTVTLTAKELLLRKGTMGGASAIIAPSPTKSGNDTHDPTMHQAKQGKPWSRSVKCHFAVDAVSGRVRTMIGTAVNVKDVPNAPALAHGEEPKVFANANHQGFDNREDMENFLAHWHLALRTGLCDLLDGPSRDGGVQPTLATIPKYKCCN